MEVYFAMNGKIFAETIRNSNFIDLCAHITLNSASNANIVEWLCPYLLCKCSLILLSPFTLAQREEITPLMRILLCAFLK